MSKKRLKNHTVALESKPPIPTTQFFYRTDIKDDNKMLVWLNGWSNDQWRSMTDEEFLTLERLLKPFGFRFTDRETGSGGGFD